MTDKFCPLIEGESQCSSKCAWYVEVGACCAIYYLATAFHFTIGDIVRELQELRRK